MVLIFCITRTQNIPSNILPKFDCYDNLALWGFKMNPWPRTFTWLISWELSLSSCWSLTWSTTCFLHPTSTSAFWCTKFATLAYSRNLTTTNHYLFLHLILSHCWDHSFLSYWYPHGNTRHVYQRWALWCITFEYIDVLKGDVSHLYSTQPNIQSCHHTVTSHEHAHVIQFALQLGRESSKDTTASSWYVRLLLTKPSLSVDSPYSRFLPRMFLSTIPS
jgi:hypothetical protein